MWKLIHSNDTQPIKPQIETSAEAQAQYELGTKHYKANNYTEAVKCFRKAAEQGLAEAQCMLGIMYENGEGVAQDKSETVKWYRNAAENGDAYAQYRIGDMYYFGYGVKQDNGEAVKWWNKAAEQGYDFVMHYLKSGDVEYFVDIDLRNGAIEIINFMEKRGNEIHGYYTDTTK